jgi:hypothetical protein
MSNHVDRFYAAVSVIVAHGNIKQRLMSAFEDHLALIENDELPVAIKEDFAELRSMMTGVEPLNGEGHVRATVRKMSIVEADECARKMLEVYTRLVRLDGDVEDLTPISIGDKPRVPPFLVKNLNS